MPSKWAQTRRVRWLAAVLAFIAGYVDCYGLLRFNVYVSFMSGNTTRFGLTVSQLQIATAVRHLLPVPCFLSGVFVGTFFAHGTTGRHLRSLCLIVAVLLAGSVATIYLESLKMPCCIVLLSVAMGVMNAAITHVGGQSINLTFVTGDLNNIGRHLALGVKRVPLSDSQGPWDTHWWRAAVLASVWVCFLLGAIIAGAGTLLLGKWSIMPAVVLLLVIAVTESEQ